MFGLYGTCEDLTYAQSFAAGITTVIVQNLLDFLANC